jgi:uncharacterized protein YjcR
VSESKNEPHSNICGAKAKSTGEPCKLKAGWGTDHPGTGRCKFHGGKSTGAPSEKMKKNKNAVKTHEHEAIWLDTLDEEEKELYHEIRTDVASQLDNEIRLTDIRIRRMMLRIQELRKNKFTTVEGPVDMTEEKNRATLGQIQDIEEAITRVQTRKAKLIDVKHKVEQREGPIDPDISQYLKAIGVASGQVWNDEDEQEEE